MLREFWDLVLIGFAYLDISLAVLVSLLLLPLVFVWEKLGETLRRFRYATKHL